MYSRQECEIYYLYYIIFTHECQEFWAFLPYITVSIDKYVIILYNIGIKKKKSGRTIYVSCREDNKSIANLGIELFDLKSSNKTYSWRKSPYPIDEQRNMINHALHGLTNTEIIFKCGNPIPYKEEKRGISCLYDANLRDICKELFIDLAEGKPIRLEDRLPAKREYSLNEIL